MKKANKKTFVYVSLKVFILFILLGYKTNTLQAEAEPGQLQCFDLKRVHHKDVQALRKCFTDNGYELNSQKGIVPPLLVMHFPKNMGETPNHTEKKETFIQAILPLILATNHRVLQDRQRLIHLKKQQETVSDALSTEDQNWLESLLKRYNIKKGCLKTLLLRVDVVPVSLALAQAAVETGWGTSFAARHKNALFGVTLPSGVKAYKSLEESTHAYLHNLNTHNAYHTMRTQRAEMRTKGKKFCAHKIMATMTAYCEYRERYVRYVQEMIRSNNLKRFDKIALGEEIIIKNT